ncbi:hypothetical protein TTHERM_00193820 (macronuclear) [Tetrahymena thermophila SB210]|uniref:Uncharacterized protein n=1 Tax=Tetrahymena thermophila (strain SB210) TaxID=312017 RepID=Q23KF3_TETTS|nr:hypothetical protein TTHERM_00193820 [Tetrahymena thermophila SB210]EAR96890.1 hypothetical protein TTHERM_00193820 [Tetrahymena thermophila SB210]|eukprot:XP_001017135.1 hypothetical protein TTHERM_00193820 [Tetrahymena thermophila SB210]
MQNPIPPHLVKLNPPILIKLNDKFLQKQQLQPEKDEVDFNMSKNYNSQYFQRKGLKSRPPSISSPLSFSMQQYATSPIIKNSSTHSQGQKKLREPIDFSSQQNILYYDTQQLNTQAYQYETDKSAFEEKYKINQNSNHHQLLQNKNSAPGFLQTPQKRGVLLLSSVQKKRGLNKIDEESDQQYTDYEFESENYLYPIQKKQDYQNLEEQFKYQIFDDQQKKKFLEYIKNQDTQSLEKLFKERMESILKCYNQQIDQFQENQQRYKKQNNKIKKLEQQIHQMDSLIKKQKFKIDILQNQLYQERQSQLTKSYSSSTFYVNKIQSGEFIKSKDNLEIQNI